MFEKCPNTEFSQVPIFLYSVRIREITDHKKLRIWILFSQWLFLRQVLVFQRATTSLVFGRFSVFHSPPPPPPRPKTRDVVPRWETRTGLRNSHCVKIIQIRSYYWSIFSHIRSKYGPEKTPYLDTFRSLRINWIKIVNIVLSYDRGVFRIQSDQGC